MATDSDDKNAKFESQQEHINFVRRVFFYALFVTLIADTYASKAEVLNHLTLWSWIVHTLYFELHLASSPMSARLLHGPSFTGAHALFAMYCWTLFANPQMEYDLAPEGRAEWLILARAAFLHFAPVVFHWIDINQSKITLREAYKGYGRSMLFQFWAMVGGYFAMGLTWEQFNGDASATYNVTIVSPETYVLVSKAIGVISCAGSYFLIVKPSLCEDNN